MTKFSDLNLDANVMQAIAEAGYESPTPIQAGAIPPALEGRDVLGIAQTGTGKTASFTLPMITRLAHGRARARMPRSLVLAPTRELAAQVAENFDVYAKHTKLTKALLIGGVSFGEQDKLIDRGVDVLIATPGRLLDHFERGRLLLTGVQIMVVDEADRMLDMGFIPDIERIFQLTPFTRQTLFFSATMAPEIERITNTFLHAPARVEVARQATTSETITQKLVSVTPPRKDQQAKAKRELLRALIAAEGEACTNAIIFCNRKVDVDIVAKSLKSHGFDAAPIHGDLEQSQRMRTLDAFRDGKLQLLIASDVAARGLDIPAVSHVFNYDLPSHAEDYVHRIGRTGRAGRKGTAYSIATPSDEKYLSQIEALVKMQIPRADPPEGFSLSEAAHAEPRKYDDARDSRRGPRSRGRDSERTRPERDRAERDRPERERPERSRSEGRSEGRSEERRRAAPVEDVEAEAPIALPEAPRREERRDDRSEGRGDGRRDRQYRRDRDDGPQVIGMGDHVPEFMLRSFRPTKPFVETTEESGRKPARENRRGGAQDTVPAVEEVDGAAAQPGAEPAGFVAQSFVAQSPVLDAVPEAEFTAPQTDIAGFQTETLPEAPAADAPLTQPEGFAPVSDAPFAEPAPFAESTPFAEPSLAEPTGEALAEEQVFVPQSFEAPGFDETAEAPGVDSAPAEPPLTDVQSFEPQYSAPQTFAPQTFEAPSFEQPSYEQPSYEPQTFEAEQPSQAASSADASPDTGAAQQDGETSGEASADPSSAPRISENHQG